MGSSTTRSENQAELPTSARTKTAVVQRCSAAGAGTITTIRYPAQLWAISWSFLPTAVLQKLSYHYLLQGDKIVDRTTVCPAPDSPHPPWRVQCGVVAG